MTLMLVFRLNYHLELQMKLVIREFNVFLNVSNTGTVFWLFFCIYLDYIKGVSSETS